MSIVCPAYIQFCKKGLQSSAPRPLRGLLSVLGDLPGLPAFPRLLTQLPLGLLLEPPFLSFDIADKGVLLAVPKEIHPVLQSFIDLLLGLAPFLLPQYLELGLAPVAVHLRVIKRQVHVLHTAHVGRSVLSEAAGDETAGGINASEDVVRAAGAVDTRAGGDVVDGAVDGEVDGLGWVGTIVEGEVFGGYVLGPVLGASSRGQSS